MKTINELLDLLALNGGKIVSTAALKPYEIENARQTGRMFVNEDSLGFVWEPECPISWFPKTSSEIRKLEEWISKYHPIDPPMPVELEPENFMKRLYGPGSGY